MIKSCILKSNFYCFPPNHLKSFFVLQLIFFDKVMLGKVGKLMRRKEEERMDGRMTEIGESWR